MRAPGGVAAAGPGWSRRPASSARTGVRVYVDEGCTDAASVVAAAAYADGVVVKLCKGGGIRGTRRVMAAARERGLGLRDGRIVLGDAPGLGVVPTA